MKIEEIEVWASLSEEFYLAFQHLGWSNLYQSYFAGISFAWPYFFTLKSCLCQGMTKEKLT